MKKIMVAFLAFSSITASANERINSYSSESRIHVALYTFLGAGSLGTLASFLCDDCSTNGSRLLLCGATALGGYAGWWWSSSNVPEERFNTVAKLFDQDTTQDIMHALLNASHCDEVYQQMDRAFDFHAYPRSKFVKSLTRLLKELRENRALLKEAIAIEIERQSPNNTLIGQGRIYVQIMDQYIAAIKEWLPKLKNDHTYLLQNASHEAQLAKEAAERAETEAAFARMDAESARWEAQIERERIKRELAQQGIRPSS